MRVLGVSFLLCCAVWADRAGEMVKALASADPAVREAARRWLAMRGDEVQAVLEKALASPDAEVRASVVALLRALGRVEEPAIPELAELRHKDDGRRVAAARTILRKYGPELLAELFQTPAPKLAVVPGKDTFEAGQPNDVPLRILNVGKHAGWAGHPRGGRLTGTQVRGFGRLVSFPFPLKMGLGGGAGCGRGWRHDARHFSWLEPNAETTRVARVHVASAPLGRIRGRLDVPLTTRISAYGRPFAVHTPARVGCTFEYFAVPGRGLRGVTREKTRLTATRRGDAAVLKLTCADEKSLAPRDFSSTWVLVRDGKGKVVDYGPADGGDRKPRRYDRKDLADVRTLTARFRLPKKTRVSVVYGTRFTRGTVWGHVVVSNRILLLNNAPPPVTSKGP